ncbi:MAG TPA: cytochrome c family protein [Alphaproteobacteria bacterium]|nr:cytochrome c family protein [Alphaproteobacteria bacterium]
MKIMNKHAILAVALTALAAGPALADDHSSCNLQHGEAVFNKYCKACHVIEKGAKNTIGPNLWGVVGSHVGRVPGYNFSQALRSADVVLTKKALNEWLTNPRDFIPKTKMPFAGIPKQKDRTDVICYLASKSDNGQSAGQ